MKALIQIGYKLIVISCIIATLFIFVVNTPVSFASKVKEDAFYYSGTTKGSYTVSKSFWEKLIDALGAILDYLLGIMTMGLRIVFVGWTALLEQSLTWLLEGATGTEINVDGVDPVGIVNSDDYITIEAIVFNKVTLFNIDVFDTEVDNKYNSLGQELKEGEQSDIGEDSFIITLRETIAGWYYTFRLIALMVMLILLIYIGIQLAIASSIKQKALYKQVLKDWVVGLVLVFTMHYIILAMISFNDMLVSEISKLATGYEGEKAVYEYGIKERGEKEISNAELEMSIYDEVRTRAYDAKLTVGTVGMILYMILVYYAWKFSFMYLKRYLVVAVLMMMSPFVAVSYAYNKVRTGKTPIFTNWLKELFFMIILQSIHALLYVVFFKQALAMSLSSIGGMIFSFIILHFISNAEEIFKKIFNINGNLTNDVAKSKLQDVKGLVSSASLGIASSKTAAAMTRGAARVASKPARLAANFGIGKYMEHKANRLDKQEAAIKEINKKLIAEAKDPIATPTQKKKAARIARESRLDTFKEASDLLNKTDLSNEERERLAQLRKVIPAKRKKFKNMTDDDFIDAISNKSKKYTKKLAIKQSNAMLANNLINKWNEIIDPYQYVNNERDEDGKIIKGKYKRKKNEYSNENWGPILKHLSKKQDGVGKALSKYNFNYIFDVTKNDTKAVANFWKASIMGFSGLFLGLPLAIVEPGIGAAALAKGISDSYKIFGGYNRARIKNLKGISLDYNGQYHLVGYNGKAIETMANGIQSSAIDGIEEFNQSIEEHNKNVVKRVKKHKKVYENIVNYDLANTHLRDSFRITSTPGRAVRTIATGNVLTGHLFQNLKMNSYLMYHDYVRDSRRRVAKKEADEGLESLESFFNNLADNYNEIDEQKKDIKQANLSKKIEDIYGKEVENKIDEVNKMTDAQLMVQLGDYEKIEFETTIDGKKQLSGSTEKDLISNSIIEAAQKSGVASVEEYNLDGKGAKLDQVKKIINDRLAQQGIIGKDGKAEDIITDIDKKILEQNSKIKKENPNAVQNKIIDDAIIEEIRTKGSKGEVSSIDSDKIAERAEKSIGNVPTSESSNVVALMNNGKARESEKTITREAVQARKTIMASKLSLSAEERESSRERARQKALRELDASIISGIDTGNPVIESVEEASESKVDNVLEILQLNTEREKTKKELIEVSQKTKSEKRKMFLSSLYDDSGMIDSKKLAEKMAFVDGSRKAVDNYNSRVDETIGSSDVLAIMKKVREQKNI